MGTKRSWWRRLTVTVRSAVVVATAALSLAASAALAYDVPIPGCPGRTVRVTGNQVQLIDTATGNVIFGETTSGHVRIVLSTYCCAYAIIDSTGTIIVRRGEGGALVTSSSPTAPNSNVIFSDSWCAYAIITPGGSVLVINADTKAVISSTGPVTGKAFVDFGPLGKLYAVIDSLSITVINGNNSHIVVTINGTTPDSYIVWSSDCTKFAVVTPGVGITVFDAATGGIIGSTGPGQDVVFDPPCGFHFEPSSVAVPMVPPWLVALGVGAVGAAQLRRRRRAAG